MKTNEHKISFLKLVYKKVPTKNTITEINCINYKQITRLLVTMYCTGIGTQNLVENNWEIVSTATFLLVKIPARVVANYLAQVDELVLVANAIAGGGGRCFWLFGISRS